MGGGQADGRADGRVDGQIGRWPVHSHSQLFLLFPASVFRILERVIYRWKGMEFSIPFQQYITRPKILKIEAENGKKS